METVIEIVARCIGIILLAVVTYVVVPAIKQWRNTKLTATQQEQLTFWVETSVLWARQWLQTSTGEEKKEAVMEFVQHKVTELGLPFSQEDVDKAIEATYGAIKDMVNTTAGTTVIRE